MSAHNSIRIHTPDWPAPTHIKAMTTTRKGGVSHAPYDSLNCGAGNGDSESAVRENRRALIEQYSLPADPVWLQQVHGTQIVELVSASAPAEPLVADGTWTKQAQVVCAVVSADCLPLLLTNRRGDRVGAVHAGWRGMANGIIERAVAALAEAPSEIIAWAGPCIGPDAFEVGLEVPPQLGGSESVYRKTARPDRVLANLYQLAGERLESLGVDQYSHSNACTYNDTESFFSYRRDGECGRMASVIWIDQ